MSDVMIRIAALLGTTPEVLLGEYLEWLDKYHREQLKKWQ